MPPRKIATDRYPLNQSPLYALRSKKKLAEILLVKLADVNALIRSENYRVFILEEDTCPFVGKVKKARSVQEPKRQLRQIHERLRALLMRVQPPEYAHAAVKGRSYRTNGMVHVNAESVATFDIRDFYRSTRSGSVYNFFREKLLCSPDVASLLARLACYRDEMSRSALPTGSPLSPVLSLYVNASMFDDLNNLAIESELKFSCYVDDIAFSGISIPGKLAWQIEECVRRHGHKIAASKTKFFRGSKEKHITGLVLSGRGIQVPHARFKKARKIEDVLSSTPAGLEEIKLLQKLGGLLGEAAYLDQRFRPWSLTVYKRLRDANDRYRIAQSGLLQKTSI